MEKMQYEQSEVVGELLLTPIQKWFWESSLAKPNHFNQAIMLKTSERIKEEEITAVFDAIAKHHDILRMVCRDSEHRLVSSDENMGYELCEYDFRGARLNEKELAKEIEEKSSEMQSSINLETGPLMKIGLFRAEEADYLMVCIHHLAVDGVSWRILIEDIEIGFKQYLAGTKIKFSERRRHIRHGEKH